MNINAACTNYPMFRILSSSYSREPGTQRNEVMGTSVIFFVDTSGPTGYKSILGTFRVKSNVHNLEERISNDGWVQDMVHPQTIAVSKKKMKLTSSIKLLELAKSQRPWLSSYKGSSQNLGQSRKTVRISTSYSSTTSQRPPIPWRWFR